MIGVIVLARGSSEMRFAYQPKVMIFCLEGRQPAHDNLVGRLL